jgi:hypothetical protein
MRHREVAIFGPFDFWANNTAVDLPFADHDRPSFGATRSTQDCSGGPESDKQGDGFEQRFLKGIDRHSLSQNLHEPQH